jgi:predicted dinucleotide-binding enzyme
MPNVIVVIGAGQIGQAIARRVGVGKHVVLADRTDFVRCPAWTEASSPAVTS